MRVNLYLYCLAFVMVATSFQNNGVHGQNIAPINIDPAGNSTDESQFFKLEDNMATGGLVYDSMDHLNKHGTDAYHEEPHDLLMYQTVNQNLENRILNERFLQDDDGEKVFNNAQSRHQQGMKAFGKTKDQPRQNLRNNRTDNETDVDMPVPIVDLRLTSNAAPVLTSNEAPVKRTERQMPMQCDRILGKPGMKFCQECNSFVCIKCQEGYHTLMGGCFQCYFDWQCPEYFAKLNENEEKNKKIKEVMYMKPSNYPKTMHAKGESMDSQVASTAPAKENSCQKLTKQPGMDYCNKCNDFTCLECQEGYHIFQGGCLECHFDWQCQKKNSYFRRYGVKGKAGSNSYHKESGQFTAPPHPYFLWVNKRQNDTDDVILQNPHDTAAMNLSNKLVDMKDRIYYENVGQARNFETFGHQVEKDGKWRFWIIEDAVDDKNVSAIYLREVVKDGEESKTIFKRQLFYGAANPKLWLPSADQATGQIVMAFEMYDQRSNNGSKLAIAQYASVELMKLNKRDDLVKFPRTLQSVNDRKPSFYYMKWRGNIRTSKMTLVYEYETADGDKFIAKGIYKYSPFNPEQQWKTYPTKIDQYYERLGLEKVFGQMQKVKYEDYEYLITDAYKKNEATGELEKQIVLSKWTMVPLAILPPVIPLESENLPHFSSPSLRLVNDKISAFSFQAQSDLDSGNYTQFVYLTDVANFDKSPIKKRMQQVDTVRSRPVKYKPVQKQKPSLIEEIKTGFNTMITHLFRW